MLEQLLPFLTTQHGLVTTAQARQAGLTSMDLTRLVRRGELATVFRGVHRATSDEVTYPQWALAAVLSAGPQTWLSHLAALALHGAHWTELRAHGVRPRLSVTRLGGRNQRTDLIVHRSSTLTLDQVTVVDAVPVTTLARTLADLNDDPALANYVRNCLRQGLVTGTELWEVAQAIRRSGTNSRHFHRVAALQRHRAG